MPRRPGVIDPASGPGVVRRGLFAVLCLLPLFFSLGNHEIVGDSEARYGLVARGMAFQGASWWAPTLHGEPHLTKPPLTYWLHAASLRAFGDHLWALRLPGAVCGALTLGIVYVTARRLHGRRTAVVAAGLLAVTPLFVAVHRMALTDGPLTLFTTASLVCALLFVRSAKNHQNTVHWLLGFGIAASLAVLTKGPAAWPAVLVAVLWSMLQADLKYKILISIALWISITPLLFWVWSSAAATPEAWAVWRYQMLDRVIGRGDHPEPWWFFVPVFLLGLLPATALLPWRYLPGRVRGVTAHLFSGWNGSGELNASTLWALHVVVTVVVFSLISGKLMSYLTPVAPSLVLLVAPLLVDRFNKNNLRRLKGAWALGLVAWVGLAMAEDRYADRNALGPIVSGLEEATGLTHPRVYTVGFTDRRLAYHTDRPTRRIDPRVLPEAWAALPKHELVLLAEPAAWDGFADDPNWDLETMYEPVRFHVEHAEMPRYRAYRPLLRWRQPGSFRGDAELHQ